MPLLMSRFMASDAVYFVLDTDNFHNWDDGSKRINIELPASDIGTVFHICSIKESVYVTAAGAVSFEGAWSFEVYRGDRISFVRSKSDGWVVF